MNLSFMTISFLSREIILMFSDLGFSHQKNVFSLKNFADDRYRSVVVTVVNETKRPFFKKRSFLKNDRFVFCFFLCRF